MKNGCMEILSQRGTFLETFAFRLNPSIVFNRNCPDILILVDWVEIDQINHILHNCGHAFQFIPKKTHLLI